MSLKEKIKVLIVDDTTTSRALICQSIEEIGIKRYSWDKNGADALKSLSNSLFHLVISDYNMPKMDGLELLKSMRSNPTTQKAGFILLTGTKDPKVIERGKQLGMNNFIEKPFTTEKLRACIEAVVGRL